MARSAPSACSSTAPSPASRTWRTTSTCRSVESSAGVRKLKLSDQHGPATARARRAIPLSARAVLTVDLTALRANWARLNQASGRAEGAGVIKADAYGLGLGPIAKALTSEGRKTFFVASLDEGRAAREG